MLCCCANTLTHSHTHTFQMEVDAPSDNLDIFSCTDVTCSEKTLLQSTYDAPMYEGDTNISPTGIFYVLLSTDNLWHWFGFSATWGPSDPVPVCGDGVRVPGYEGCDDGNLVDGVFVFVHL